MLRLDDKRLFVISIAQLHLVCRKRQVEGEGGRSGGMGGGEFSPKTVVHAVVVGTLQSSFSLLCCSTGDEDMYWKEIGAAMALTSLARGRIVNT